MSRNITSLADLNVALFNAAPGATVTLNNSLNAEISNQTYVLTIPNGKTLTNASTIASTLNLTSTIFNNGTINIAVDGTINNYGVIINGGTINNNGTIWNKVNNQYNMRGSIINAGTINGRARGGIDNQHTIINVGTINNGGTINNNGIIYNKFSTSITTGSVPTGTPVVGEWPTPESQNIIGLYELNLVLDNWGKPGNL